MKITILILTLSLLISSSVLYASEHFNAPLPAGGKIFLSEKSNIVNLQYGNLSFKEITNFYKNEFQNKDDIDWNEFEKSERILIYDWGNRKWHRINIVDKGHGKGILVTISKDSWTWIIGTLAIRFVGVFVVLIILMIALYISGSLISLSKAKTEDKKA